MKTSPLISIFLFFLLLLSSRSVISLKFLLLHPFYAGSHVLTLHSITEELIAKGHLVTTIRFRDNHVLSLKPLGVNHTEIHLSLNNSEGRIPFISREENGKFEMPFELLWNKGLSMKTLFTFNPWTLVTEYCESLLGNKALFGLLKAQNFDLALVDLVYNECGLGLANHLHLPIVGYWAFSFSGGECEYPSVATPPSHIPAFMSELTDKMTFFQRIYNFMIKVFFSRPMMVFHCYVVDKVISKHSIEVPSAMQMLANLNGVLINSNEVLDYPRLKSSTVLNIGGLQIAKAPRPLPKNIQDWIDGAEHGIILFSMGFIFNPKVIPKSRLTALLNAFSRLPQRVIVKFEETIDVLPKNVLVLPFIPQQDILSSPKTKVFFTHCGMHGVLEAIYYGVPMVGMPIFIDQGDVAVRMVEKGIVERLDKYASEEEIYRAITTVRDNPKYKENISKLSKLLRQWRTHPMDDAIWLMEFLAKNRGAPHLLLSAKDLNFIQYHSIDVIFFIVLVTLTLSALLSKICNVFCTLNKKRKLD